ncbi:metallophosphoesterase [Streptomyces cocklensis]|jgi:3',5'-cyclic AMP phosphodiesterase CpdA|uniref:3\',5\'-cyclic AMP phosphodiesterase CpdA n=1 Tax=Actinacidiphila cocklensis TaxID=887465 RepID=A0A9W4E478_9ACTN|nr:metallophosphoesterase [Actinacidiphila cocklensis]MDD1059192.1 metallophosphoesterase [Actinacidiphila cocklensis]CAG6399112.1 3\\',5\\'-cyclic AMP phosphodiesterase CpdA [Actinacidiphila cocklensis]
MTGPDGAHLLAISDLHVGYPANREIVEALRPEHDDDWLLVAGDVAERTTDITWALSTLKQHFSTVIWLPGNHELWTPPDDPVQLRGDARYRHLVDDVRRLGVITPEDPYPLWEGPRGPVAVVPMFLLYDYTWRDGTPGARTKDEALAKARAAGVVCTDEMFLHPDPLPGRDDWCRARVAETARRLDALDPDLPTVLANHWPLHREPTAVLHYPEFALWCGTEQTEQWHTRYRATEVVYGHLHIPRVIWRDGVRFTEVSLGYPREWGKRPAGPAGPRRILAGRQQAAHR